MEIAIGKSAPKFTLSDGNGQKVALKDFLGKKVILYFYPKDNTSGCTTEACDFRDNTKEINTFNAIIIGISPDSIESHKKFSDKFDLPFILLSDQDKKVINKYGVWKEKSMYGKKYMGVERSTFIIDEKGKISDIFRKVRVKNHIQEIINKLKELAK